MGKWIRNLNACLLVDVDDDATAKQVECWFRAVISQVSHLKLYSLLQFKKNEHAEDSSLTWLTYDQIIDKVDVAIIVITQQKSNLKFIQELNFLIDVQRTFRKIRIIPVVLGTVDIPKQLVKEGEPFAFRLSGDAGNIDDRAKDILREGLQAEVALMRKAIDKDKKPSIKYLLHHIRERFSKEEKPSHAHELRSRLPDELDEDKNKLQARKYMVANLKRIENYYELSTAQANRAFKSAWWFTIIAVLLFIGAICFFSFFTDYTSGMLLASILSAISEFISVVLFHTYNKSIETLNYYHRALHEDERFLVCMDFADSIEDNVAKDKLFEKLISAELQMNALDMFVSNSSNSCPSSDVIQALSPSHLSESGDPTGSSKRASSSGIASSSDAAEVSPALT